MSTHNIRFQGEIRKILYDYPLLSGALYVINKNIVVLIQYGLFLTFEACCRKYS